MEEAYQFTVTALETSNTELTMDFVKGKLLDAELKEKKTSECKPTKKEYVFESSLIKCYNCGQPNHIARNCTNKAQSSGYRQQRGRGNYRGNSYRSNKGKNFKKQPTANLGEAIEDKSVPFIASNALYTNNGY